MTCCFPAHSSHLIALEHAIVISAAGLLNNPNHFLLLQFQNSSVSCCYYFNFSFAQQSHPFPVVTMIRAGWKLRDCGCLNRHHCPGAGARSLDHQAQCAFPFQRLWFRCAKSRPCSTPVSLNLLRKRQQPVFENVHLGGATGVI